MDNIINAVESQKNLSGIQLNNYNLTKFQPEAVELIKNFAQLRQLVSLMKERKASGKKCKTCEVTPPRIFSDLYIELDSKLEGFIEQFRISLKLLVAKSRQANQNVHCNGCVCESYKDLTFLFINYQSLSKKIVNEGFSVVVE